MNTIRASLSVASACAFLALTGCASTDQSPYAWSQGWRKAEVLAVQTAAEMERPGFSSCVRSASSHQLATTRFAVVKYRQMSRTQRRAVPLQAGEKVAPGDAVYVKADDCSTPIVHRTASIRPG